MHEMALCRGVVQIIEEQAKAHAYTRVKTVRLEIGPLATVEPEALRFCFDAAARGTLAENAKLDIITTAASAWCFSCGETITISERNGVCPNCGSYQVQVTGGMSCGSRNWRWTDVRGLRMRRRRNAHGGRRRPEA